MKDHVRRLAQAALGSALFVLLASCGGHEGTPSVAQPTQAVPPSSASQASQPAAAVAKGVMSGAPASGGASDIYIVRLAEPAVAAYSGGIGSHKPTRAAKGNKFDAKSSDAAGYRAHLKGRQDDVMRKAGVFQAVRYYNVVFNGFAAHLTQAQVQKLALTPGVLAVSRNEMFTTTTSSTPDFIGLTGREGFWREYRAKGEGVIIGMIDSGVWPEHPSFSDRRARNNHNDSSDDDDRDNDGGFAYRPVRGWNGDCVAGERFAATDCNRKLIGARYYNVGWGGDAGIRARFPYEFVSARDYDGHGTHTASTAGGNQRVQVTGDAAAFGKISGIAPRARIAVYKTNWHDSARGTSSGFTVDLVAAIDDAVADGVDVINYSIGGSVSNFAEPVQLAFLAAADAGVFVAASAGNSGPDAATVEHPSPWITTVAAGTHNRGSRGSATLGNGTVLTGASLTAAVGPAPLIDATLAAAAGASADDARRCFLGADNTSGQPALDPAKVAGKIVLCERGANVLVNKAQAVKDAGGIGMILTNVAGGATTTVAALHVVPALHIAYDAATYAALKAYAADPQATATLAAATFTFDVPAPFTAGFSSRGPTPAGGGSILKPDLIAPGQDIVAAVAPPANNGRLFDQYSGTSMSSPHVAGLAALLKEVHPDWSPMAIKSALMTTAYDVLDGPGTSASVIFSQGAGHIDPNRAANPGLVFDSGFVDWAGFLCGASIGPAFCAENGIPVLEASDLNTPSIAIGALGGSRTVTRTVTNVSNRNATYSLAASGLEGIDVSFSPASLTVRRGQTRSFSVTFTRKTAALDAYAGGYVTLSTGASSSGHRDRNREPRTVRMPVVIKPVALAAPAEVTGSYRVTFGYSGAFSATPRGLVGAGVAAGQVATDGVATAAIAVPAGTTVLRFALFDTDVSVPSDLDLVILGPAGTVVGSSGSGTSREEVTLINPAAGTYIAAVLGFATPGNAPVDFKLFGWVLGTTDAGNMTVTAPGTATLGATADIGLTFNGLVPGVRYLGAVAYGGDPAVPAPTIVRVDP